MQTMPTKREAEEALRRAGASKAEARRILAHGMDGPEFDDERAAALLAAMKGEAHDYTGADPSRDAAGYYYR